MAEEVGGGVADVGHGEMRYARMLWLSTKREIFLSSVATGSRVYLIRQGVLVSCGAARLIRDYLLHSPGAQPGSA